MGVMNDDDLPDFEMLSLGEPHNESHGAICAMLTEHVVDERRLNLWLVGLMVVSLHHSDALDVELSEALEAVQVMSEADMAVSAFEMMNTLMGLASQKRQRRGRRSST
jgi:hypothetical protein